MNRPEHMPNGKRRRKKKTMANEPVQNQEQPTAQQAQPSLLSKPQRREKGRKARRLSLFLLIFGGIGVLGGGGVLVWYLLTSHAPAQTQAPMQTHCISHIPRDWLKQQLAVQLHLSEDQITAEVQRGEQIQDIASAQGISPQQLYQMEKQLMQEGNTMWLRQGCIPPPVATAQSQRFDQLSPQALDATFTQLFRG
jgi:hypothetical protein